MELGEATAAFCDHCGKPAGTRDECIGGDVHRFVDRRPGRYYCIGCGATPEAAPAYCATRRTHHFFHVPA